MSVTTGVVFTLPIVKEDKRHRNYLKIENETKLRIINECDFYIRPYQTQAIINLSSLNIKLDKNTIGLRR